MEVWRRNKEVWRKNRDSKRGVQEVSTQGREGDFSRALRAGSSSKQLTSPLPHCRVYIPNHMHAIRWATKTTLSSKPPNRT
eukprot:6192424-Pleurochrysis_carterae.AAC.1